MAKEPGYMIPRLNMGNISDINGKSGVDTSVGGNLVGAMRVPQEMRSSTPVRSHVSSKCGSWLPLDVSPTLTPHVGVPSTLEDNVRSMDLCRRAEKTSFVLGGNILQIQDVHTLQLKAIEVAELLLCMEEWCNRQLQERTSYLEHRMTQLAASKMDGQFVSSGIDKLVVPGTIRSRQSPVGTMSVMNRSAPNLCGTVSGRYAAGASASLSVKCSKTRTPESSRRRPQSSRLVTPLIDARHYSSLHHAPLLSQIMTSRRTASSKRVGRGDRRTLGRATDVEQGNTRSLSLSVGRRSGRSSDVEIEERCEDTVRRAKKRRNSGSAALLEAPVRNMNSRHNPPFSGRLRFTSEAAKRE